MIQDSRACDPNTLSLVQPKVLEASDYIRNSKQRPDTCYKIHLEIKSLKY